MILSQTRLMERIREKEIERDSFEGEIAAVDITIIDERERNMVMANFCFKFHK